MNNTNDYPYYRQTWMRITATLLAAAFLPLVAIGGGLYFLTMRNAPQSTHLIALLVFIAAGLLIIGAVLLTTNSLVSRLESKRRSLGVLDTQLRRTSYLSSSMELSLSYFEDIKATLLNIDSSTAVLKDDPEVKASENLMECIDQIHSQVRRGSDSVDRFLRYIQEEPPLIRETDVHEVLDHLLEIIGRELHYRNIRVRRDFRPDLPAIRSDRSKLRQVFQNIVLNAVTAIDRDGEITLTTVCREDSVAVTVGDTGQGIAPKDMEMIFEPLWTTKARGTGLGLPICREILERLGGDIQVSSSLGQGTAVTMTLPVRFDLQTAEIQADK